MDIGHDRCSNCVDKLTVLGRGERDGVCVCVLATIERARALCVCVLLSTKADLGWRDRGRNSGDQKRDWMLEVREGYERSV
jgi:hypothetical protein